MSQTETQTFKVHSVPMTRDQAMRWDRNGERKESEKKAGVQGRGTG